MHKSKQEQRDETRATILAAATRIFSEVGFAGARTDTIAAKAGVNKALLYYYFKSKEGLYLAVMGSMFREPHERMMAVLSQPENARQAVLSYVSLQFDLLAQQPRMAQLHQRMVMSNTKLMLPLLQKYGKPRNRALYAIIKRGIARGEFRKIDAHQAVASLMALIVHYFTIGPVLVHMVKYDPYSPTALKRRKAALLDFVRHAFFRDTSAKLP